MKRLASTLCLLLCFQLTAIAQLELKFAETNILTGVERVKVFDDLIIFDAVQGEQVKSRRAMGIAYTGAGDDAGVLFKVYHFQNGGKVATAFRELETGKYLVSESGKHWVEVTIFEIIDGKPKLASVEGAFELGNSPDPEPDNPDPEPSPIPSDRFDNIGQRVALWAEGLPSNAAIGDIHLTYAAMLRLDPTRSLSEIDKEKNRKIEEVTEIRQYTTLFTNLNSDIRSRSPWVKHDLADYWECIARGLGVKPASSRWQ